MKGFIKQTVAICCFGAGLFTVLGCTAYRDVVDPCWPERYNSMAAHSVRQMSMAQTAQGHKLEQTIWSTFFEVDPKTGDGTGILNDAGKETLRIISRKELLEQVWRVHEDTDTRAIDNFMVRLRRYIEDNPAEPVFLETVRGVGYRFQPGLAGRPAS